MRQPDFNKPQRQSPVGVIVMFFDTTVKLGKAFLPMLLVWLLQFDATKIVVTLLAIALFIAVTIVAAWLRYRNFLFFLDTAENEFILSEGVFSKKRTVVQIGKIQKVDISQTLLQRIIGVHEVRIDTAGTNDEEISIKAVSHQVAIRLKEELLTAAASMTEPEHTETVIPQTEKPFVKISLGSLIKMGLTAYYVRTFFLILAFFFSIYENVRHFDSEVTDDVDTGAIERYIDENPAFQVALSFFLFIFGVILVVNVIRTIFRYFGYSIARQHDSLLLSFGLMNTKNILIRPVRVQYVSVVQNFLQRKLDILEVRIRQATGGEKENKKTAIEIPGCNSAEQEDILRLLFRRIPEKGRQLSSNWRMFGFALFLYLFIPLGIYMTVRHSLPEVASVDYFVPVYAGLVILLQFFKFRNSRLFVGEDFIIRKHGAWDVTHDYLDMRKIQGITVSQLFWHKSLNIGSLTLHTAGGDLSFQLGDFETIKQYVNLWLYKIETSDSNWM